MSNEEFSAYKVDIIRSYIHHHKGVWIDIAEPDTPERWDLFEVAFLHADRWHIAQKFSNY